MLAATRAFFAARNVLEVDTPYLVNAPVTDVNIHSAQVVLPGDDGRMRFLHTSPEYAMKRLLAAGSGDIFQICHVFRGNERSALHNPEFTLLEWYRVGWPMERLMAEVAELVRHLLGGDAASRPVEQLSYRDAFLRELDLDPFEAPQSELERAAQAAGFEASRAAETERDTLLDLLLGLRVGPKLGGGRLTFVHRYPAAQAALAQLDPADPRVALRFELYADGMELANGSQELTSEEEQRRRFAADQEWRRRRGLPVYRMDQRLLAALRAGLPAASGVALGFDRLHMLAAGAHRIDDVLAFPVDVA
jgi:lysyl-tRNA synthetase class 2